MANSFGMPGWGPRTDVSATFDQSNPIYGYNNQGMFGFVTGGQKQNVTFYRRPVIKERESLEAGKPVYDEQIFVKIWEPGDRYTEIDKQATQKEMVMFPRAWNLFLKGDEGRAQPEDGTPLSVVFPNEPALVANLQTYGFWTAEQLASADAYSIQDCNIDHKHVTMAQNFLKHAKGAMNFHKHEVKLQQMQTELNAKDSQISQLKEAYDKLNSFVAANNPQFAMGQIAQHMAKPVIQPMTQEQIVNMQSKRIVRTTTESKPKKAKIIRSE